MKLSELKNHNKQILVQFFDVLLQKTFEVKVSHGFHKS